MDSRAGCQPCRRTTTSPVRNRLQSGPALEERLFYADDLPQKDRTVLEQYIATYRANAVNETLQLLTLRQFLSKFYQAVYKGRCLLVGFNLPFDLSRIASDFTTAIACLHLRGVLRLPCVHTQKWDR